MYQAGIDPTRRSTIPEFALNTLAFNSDEDGSKGYLYVQAGEALIQHYLCAVQGGAQAIHTDEAGDHAGASLGIATAAFADDEYGWIQVWGESTVRTAASCQANEGLYIHSDPGTVDDANNTTANMSIAGMIITGADQSGTDGNHACLLNFPSLAQNA